MNAWMDDEPETLFPARCHFKVIALNRAGMAAEINSAMSQLGFEEDPFHAGNRSERGTYVTFNASIDVETHDEMKTIDRVLRAIDGVKMVL